MNRRQFLQTFGVGVVAVGSLQRALAALPPSALAPQPAARSPAHHVVERLTYGITPALYQRARQGDPAALIAEQLAPDLLDDGSIERRLGDYAGVLATNGGVLAQQDAGMRQTVAAALLASVLLHAVYSERQLYERMVYFFGNHFYVYSGKGPVLFLKVDDDRDVIRPNAMTTFRQLLGASAHSPAMLVFLDNAQSEKGAPNENYSREVMELQTLGVNGGYTESDVKEVARCFTGWSVVAPRESADASISYRFRRLFHDNQPKTVFGTSIPVNGGEQDGETVLDLLANHPSTARFVSTKLARRFVSDAPSDALVDQLAATFTASGGDVRALLGDLFSADDFWNAPPKLKHPQEYLISVLRALNMDITNLRHFLRVSATALTALGQIPFGWPAPNGFPDVAGAWRDGLLERWNIALAAVTNQIPGVRMNFEPILALMEAEGVAMNVDAMLAFMGQYLLGRSLSADEAQIVADFARSAGEDLQTQVAAGIALLLASPAFQYR